MEVVSESEFDMRVCLERVLRQDEQAARDLFRHLYPLVLRLVRAHLPRRTSEEDLCQMTFIKIFANLPQYSAKAPLEHWVSRITVNTCLSQLRMEKARPEMRQADLSPEQNSLIQSLTELPENSLSSDCVAARELVERLLSSLRPRDRLIVTLLHLDGYSVEEIRQSTGWSTSVIKSRAFRARKQLRRLLEKLTSG